MILRVILSPREFAIESEHAQFEELAKALSREFLCDVAVRPDNGCTARLELAEFRDETVELFRFDAILHAHEQEAFELALGVREPKRDRQTAFQVLTRYQRLLPFSGPRSADPWLSRALELHRSLHDLKKPLVRADFDHALDTLCWLVRLAPQASIALRIAALFHDIERLSSEAERRIEHRARDYQLFKEEHAKHGSQLLGSLLRQLGLEAELVSHATKLVANHESPSTDPELLLLNDADALSFFSLNSWGFLNYFGIEHTRMKIAYTTRRMTSKARARLLAFRYHPDVERLLRAQLESFAEDKAVQRPVQDQP